MIYPDSILSKLVNTASGAYEVRIREKNPNPAYSTASLVKAAVVNPVYKAGARMWITRLAISSLTFAA